MCFPLATSLCRAMVPAAVAHILRGREVVSRRAHNPVTEVRILPPRPFLASDVKYVGVDVAVYVDSLANHGWKLRGKCVKSCHLLADTVAELDVFAESIGLKRAWRQEGTLTHYDLVASKQRAAIQNGAVLLSVKDFLEFMEKHRKR